MYDTTYSWLQCDDINDYRYMERIPAILENATYHRNKEGDIYYTGSVLGLYVSVSTNGISIKGSLCKSYLGDNFKTLTRQDTQRAIEQVSDLLLIEFCLAKMNRIDFGQNLDLTYKPEIYYPYLGECSHYTRLVQPDSIYYKNGLRTKVFYNKIEQGKTKNGILPQIWDNRNILRNELRYTSRLSKQFNMPKILAKDLYSEDFYIGMVDRWYNEYLNIDKLKELNLNFQVMKQPKDFYQHILLLKFSEMGLPNLLAIVEQMKAQNVFAHNEYYSRLKSEIKGYFKVQDPNQNTELIKELDQKMLQAKENYR